MLRKAGSSLVRAAASEREFICDAMRILYTPYAPSGTGLPPSGDSPGGLANTLAVLRTLSRMARDAGRVETLILRITVIC